MRHRFPALLAATPSSCAFVAGSFASRSLLIFQVLTQLGGNRNPLDQRLKAYAQATDGEHDDNCRETRQGIANVLSDGTAARSCRARFGPERIGP